MFSVAASAKYALKGTASSRSFATVKSMNDASIVFILIEARPFYRRIINITTVGMPVSFSGHV